jgi:hypothetical protein
MNLSEQDVHRALDIAATAAAEEDGTAFGFETVDAIAAAIPADDVAYVEWRGHPSGRRRQQRLWSRQVPSAERQHKDRVPRYLGA